MNRKVSYAGKALQAPGLDMQATVPKLALQAQRQCCQTLDALSAIKNPSPWCAKLISVRPSRSIIEPPKTSRQQIWKTNYWSKRMANGWTPERRARQSQMIQTWQPWRSATGPKTKSGKPSQRVTPKKAWSGRPLRKVRSTLRIQSQLLMSFSKENAE